MKCDLHTHTNHSDGTYTPAELVAEAKAKGLIIALTDHNTVSGLPEFLEQAQKQGVTAVGGVELSTEREGREFHLIGMFVDPESYSAVEELCLDFHRRKRQSNIDLVNTLCKLGYVINFADVEAMNVNGRVNRAHIAAELVRRGYIGSVNEAFDEILDEKCGSYVPPKRIALTDAIAFLRSIRAVPVLAHPLKEITADQLEKILPELKAAGLLGMETMHYSYDDEKIAVSKQLVRKYGFLESGGSDFHGTIRPGVVLGEGRGNLNIDDEVYLALLNKKRELDSAI